MKPFVLIGLLLGSSGQATAGVVNGEFESAAYPGNGDVYSTNPGFSLPGWTYSTVANSFFLEFGEPFGAPGRFNSGRQAVCLNYDGAGTGDSLLSQTIATATGGQLRLSFAMNEENVNHTNSPTTLLAQAGSSSSWAR